MQQQKSVHSPEIPHKHIDVNIRGLIMYKNTDFSYKLESRSMPSASSQANQLSFRNSSIQPLSSPVSNTTGWSQLGTLSTLPVLGISPILHHDNRTNWASDSGLGIKGSAICSGLGTGVHTLTSLAGGALTVSATLALAKVMPLPAVATFASAGFTTSDLAGKYLGDAVQLTCHRGFDAAPKFADSIQHMYHKNVLAIDHKLTELEALNHLNSKELRGKMSGYTPYDHLDLNTLDLYKDAITSKAVYSGTNLINHELQFIDKRPSFPVTNALVNMGARCNRLHEEQLRDYGASEIADICSKDSPAISEEMKEESKMIAELHLFKEEVIYNHPSVIANTAILADALNTKQTHSQSLQLFSRASQLKSSNTKYAVAQGLVDQGYRCDLKEELNLRVNFEDGIANRCSMPPVAQTYRRKY
jgi:hypothetical protein